MIKNNLKSFLLSDDKDHSDWVSIVLNNVNNNTVRSRKMRSKTTNWHKHESSDEMFIVLEGNITIETEDEIIHLAKGDTLVVPSQTSHRAIVEDFAHVLVIDQLESYAERKG